MPEMDLSTAEVPERIFLQEYGKCPKLNAFSLSCHPALFATRHCSRRCAELALTAVLLAGGATDGCKRP